MLAILDPALFSTLTQSGSLRDDEEEDLRQRIDDANRVIRRSGSTIPVPEWYWRKLQQEVIRPLSLRLRSPLVKRALDDLRGHRTTPLNETLKLPSSVKMWHVKPLFEWKGLHSSWLSTMERLLLHCVMQREKIIVIVRYIENRNLFIHQVGRCDLHEKQRWRLYVHATGSQPAHISCVRNQRNLDVPWTTKYDERLPDIGKFPFCPPEKWWRLDVESFRTIKSKPAWVDKKNNGWARPSTGGGYHWDVYIDNNLIQSYVGLAQINVVQWGGPSSEGIPGTIHHTPSDKKPYLNPTASWTCD